MEVTENFDIEEEDDDVYEGVLIEYDIASYPSDYTLKGLHMMWNEGDITIPDFQRSYVWSIHQASKLIESFLVGLPVPPIFLYIDNINRNLVIDGQQRLLSVIFFIDGFFGYENERGRRQVFRLSGLNSRSPYHNKQYSELNHSDQRKLDNSVLRAINIRQLSPNEDNTSVYHIFERLNTGGTPLTSQEIRNVVFRGSLFTKLRELNTDENWRIIIGKSLPDKHQKDVELILRVLGLSTHLDDYEKPMKEFLNRTAYRNRELKGRTIQQFIKNFPLATKVINDLLPPKPFNVRGPLNTSVFDSVFSVIINNIDKIPENLSERYNSLVKDDDFISLTRIGTTDTKTIRERFALVKSRLIN